MTEKRFKIIDGIKKGTHSGIWDNQKQHNQGIGDELWLGEVVGMLNEGVILAEENEQLKFKYYWYKQYKELLNENEQLKSDNNRLVNETAKVVAEHQKRVLDLIDDKIKELKNINNIPLIPRESIEVLEQLKKELQK